VKYWEIIADNLSKAGWSWGCVSALDSRGQTIFVADAHRGDGQRFVVRADEKLTVLAANWLAKLARCFQNTVQFSKAAKVSVATAPRAITPLIRGDKPDTNPTSQ
jgi:hypothetical protein